METQSVVEWFLKTFERLKKINSVQRLIFHKGFFEMIQKVFLISYRVNWAYSETWKAEVSSVIAGFLWSDNIKVGFLQEYNRQNF